MSQCAVWVAALGWLSASAAAGEIGALAWIAGYWSGEMGSARIEEIWAEPHGSTMIGMFRMVENGQPRFYEFMTIEAAGTEPVLKLRHFGPGLIAMEEKDSPLSFRLIENQNRRAVFQQTDAATRLIYERPSETDLQITLEKEKEGKASRTVFRFQQMR